MAITYKKNNVSYSYDLEFFYGMSDDEILDFIKDSKDEIINIRGHFIEIGNIRNRVSRIDYTMVKHSEDVINIFESSSVITFEKEYVESH